MKKVMTVDDSATVRLALKEALTEAGYEVHEAINGCDAMKKLADCRVDMLVTDFNMPKMDGIELIRQVRQMPGNRFIPIIMLSSDSDPGQIRAGKAAGASGWVTKPFKKDSLLSVVKMVCPAT